MASHDGSNGRDGCVERAIRAARTGDLSQLGGLFDIYRGYLLTIAREKLAPELAVKTAPSDIVQDTYVKGMRVWADFRGSTELEFQEWLKQILSTMLDSARERFLDAAKRDLAREVPLHHETNGDSRTFDLAARGDSPSSLARAAEDVQLVERALNELSPGDRQVIQFRIFEELPFEEVGARLGCSPKAASRLWSRAITNLTAELRRHDQDPAGPL
jgi:RNA polymerase sigma-70 factor (subfamily 1)